jgi:hypothetical protein
MNTNKNARISAEVMVHDPYVILGEVRTKPAIFD